MKLCAVFLCAFLLAFTALSQGPNSSDAKKAAHDIAVLTKKRDSAKSFFDKHPKSPAARQSFVSLNDKLAYATMTADGLTPHQKYAGALHIYRQTLKVAPKDEEANHWVNMIESIYKSMHRPIPKG